VIYPTSHHAKIWQKNGKILVTQEFSTFASKIKNLSSEFNVRFSGFETMKKGILLYNSPLNAVIEEQPASLQLEKCNLPADPFFVEIKENGKEFFRNLSSERFPNLRTSGLRMTSMFGSTYLCESAFSNVSFIRSRHRSSLTVVSLLSLFRLATTEIQVDIQRLVADNERPQCSH
jgi:hypothetical protein